MAEKNKTTKELVRDVELALRALVEHLRKFDFQKEYAGELDAIKEVARIFPYATAASHELIVRASASACWRMANEHWRKHNRVGGDRVSLDFEKLYKDLATALESVANAHERERRASRT